jgi:hypothetical protein
MLGRPLSPEEVEDCFAAAGKPSSHGNSRYVSCDELAAWWNSESLNPELSVLRKKMATAGSLQGMRGTGALFG